jgi:formamidase
MTGPFFVEGAEPGDALAVEILSVEAEAFGWTCLLPGFGVLADRFPDPFLVKWELADGVARSPDLPGVAIPGRPFLGLVGVCPSPERMRAFAEREAQICAEGGVALLPDAESAVPMSGEAASAGLRTIPPRETGGNMDVKEARAGATVFLPIDVPGALLSLGDIHFAQGDGESCGVAIETAGRATIRCMLLKRGEQRWLPRYPAIVYDEQATPTARPFIATTGVPVDGDGRNLALDVYAAARAALNELVDYLVATRGLSAEQAYVLASVAADLRISSIVNVPNPMVSAALPLDIFQAAPEQGDIAQRNEESR